jgi:hypothetical protein
VNDWNLSLLIIRMFHLIKRLWYKQKFFSFSFLKFYCNVFSGVGEKVKYIQVKTSQFYRVVKDSKLRTDHGSQHMRDTRDFDKPPIYVEQMGEKKLE